MKILRLTLSNLNSLQGPNAIDFTTPPLANSGLFAITGPTGAGKSTLLDAITLALYGRAARYGNVPNPDAVMSRHTGECSAEVEFSCATGTFRSVWQLQRARKKPDGKLQQAKRRVIALPAETIIAESIKDADSKILELTGLDYDRFLRSVLLAQGDFAAFLKAGPKERTDLLQQVTGTGIYQEISQAAFRRSAGAQQAHAALLNTHAAVAVLTSDERQKREAALAAYSQRVATLTALLQDLGKRTNEAQTWLEIEKAGRQLEFEQADHAKATRAAAPALAQLQRHEKAAAFIAEITSIDRLGAENIKDQTALRTLEINLPALAQRLQVAEAAAEQAKATLTTDERRIAALQVLWHEVTELDQALATAREALRQTCTHHAGLEQNVVSLAGSLAREQTALQASTDAYTAVTAWLTAHAGDATLAVQLPEIQAAHARWAVSDKSAAKARDDFNLRQKEVEQLLASVRAFEGKLPPLEAALKTHTDAVEAASRALEAVGDKLTLREIEEHHDQTRERRLALEKLSAEAQRLRTAKSELGACTKQATQTDADLAASTALLEKLKQQLEAATNLLNSHRTTLALAEKVQSLDGHRAELQTDVPCPLCGSLHHPYAEPGTQPSAELETIRRQVSVAEAATTTAQKAFNAADKRHSVLLGDQKRLAGEQAKQQSTVAALLTAWNSAATPFGLADQFENDSILAAQLVTAQTEETRRSHQVAAFRAAEIVLQKAKVDQQTAQTELERTKNEITKQKALTTQAQAQLPALEATFNEHGKTCLTEQSAFGQWVAPFGRVTTELVDVPALLGELKNRVASYASHQAEAAKCATDLSARKAKCDAFGQQLATEKVAAAVAKDTLTRAQQDVSKQEVIRKDKFGTGVVIDARGEAEATLKRLREDAAKAQATTEATRQEHTTATQEKARLQTAITDRTAEHAALVERLSRSATATGFSSDAELRSSILSPADAKVHTDRREHLNARRVALDTQATSLATRRAALPPSAGIDAPNLPALQSEHATGEGERNALQSSLGEVRAILKGDDEQRIRQADYTVQIDAAHREYARWDKLRALIGSADGSVFARFAQGLTLERLTILANRHLVQLNRRYSIRRAADGEAGDLELEIVDHDQADAARPMRSLSGGESFLVSLALALGLSELASGRTSIESLFIDEGFGSLDADTLEIAMSALENLQADGKTIGVISHVPAMQERIPAQINVTKETGGCSRVRIVA
jgi:exonuclease SbcC